MPLRLQLVVLVAVLQAVPSSGVGVPGHSGGDASLQGVVCLLSEEDEGSSMVQLPARFGEHAAANVAGQKLHHQTAVTTGRSHHINAVTEGHGPRRDRPVLSQQEAHVVQLLGLASSLSAKSADELSHLQKVQASARSELDVAREENVRMQAAVVKLRTRGQKLEHQLVMKGRLHARHLPPSIVKEVKAFLHSWRLLACIGGLIFLVTLCGCTASAFFEYDRQMREGLQPRKFRALVRDRFLYPFVIADDICSALSWRTKIGTLLLLVFCIGGFALLWRKHMIQPFLKQVVTFLWIAVFLIFVVVVVLYEMWYHMRGKMQIALEVMQQVHDKTDSLLHRMGAPPPRDAGGATIAVARTTGDLGSTIAY